LGWIRILLGCFCRQVIFFLAVFLSGCNSFPETHQEIISPTPTHENLSILSGKSASSDLLLRDVVERISKELKYNQKRAFPHSLLAVKNSKIKG
jgi:hypothetical protein